MATGVDERCRETVARMAEAMGISCAAALRQIKSTMMPTMMRFGRWLRWRSFVAHNRRELAACWSPETYAGQVRIGQLRFLWPAYPEEVQAMRDESGLAAELLEKLGVAIGDEIRWYRYCDDGDESGGGIVTGVAGPMVVLGGTALNVRAASWIDKVDDDEEEADGECD